MKCADAAPRPRERGGDAAVRRNETKTKKKQSKMGEGKKVRGNISSPATASRRGVIGTPTAARNVGRWRGGEARRCGDGAREEENGKKEKK